MSKKIHRRDDRPRKPASAEKHISISFPERHWVVILSALEPLVRKTAEVTDAMRARGERDISKLKPEEIAILGGPVIVRGVIIKELVKHGVMKPEAAEQMGIDRVLELAHGIMPGVKHADKALLRFHSAILSGEVTIEVEDVDINIDENGDSAAHFAANRDLDRYAGKEGTLEFQEDEVTFVMGGTVRNAALFTGSRPLLKSV